MEVGRIAADLRISQPNASQHLAVMRAVGVVEPNRLWRLGKIVFNKTYWHTVPKGRV